jgi:hypothetical protein
MAQRYALPVPFFVSTLPVAAAARQPDPTSGDVPMVYWF